MKAAIGLLVEKTIDGLVRLTGRRVRRGEAPWLQCVLGDSGIGTGIYERVAREEGLLLSQPEQAGLIGDFSQLQGPSFAPELVHPRIRHFYEHTAMYKLDVWSEVHLVGRLALWVLVEFVSQRMDQLNFPISSLEVARGMTSEVLQLHGSQGELKYTGWLRRMRSTGKVIFAGIYGIVSMPGEENPCVKVTFPGFGSSNVYLSPKVYPDGSFGLISTGSKYGKSGFYRLVESGPEHWRVRYFSSLHEVFHLYQDEDGDLRTDHKILFLGMTVVSLHYKMTLRTPKPVSRS